MDTIYFVMEYRIYLEPSARIYGNAKFNILLNKVIVNTSKQQQYQKLENNELNVDIIKINDSRLKIDITKS